MMMFLLRNAECFAPQPLGRADVLVAGDKIAWWGTELALSDHRSSQPTLDELLRIAADAHVAGLMTGKAGLVHLHMGDELERVLPAFTSNVAASLRLPAKGRIDVGADADLVVLDADGKVRDVMARGRWQVREGRTVRYGTFERHGAGDREEHV